MLFADQVLEDKGLFTFYREQAENEQQLRIKRKLKKQLNKMRMQPHPQLPPLSLPKQLSRQKSPTIRKVNSLKQTTAKVKPITFKQHLMKSVVDMSEHIQQQRDSQQLISIKIKESTYALKSKRYKLQDMNLSIQHHSVLVEDESMLNQIKIEPFHRRSNSQQLSNNRMKQAIHSNRVSVELPQIYREQQHDQAIFRPKKSIKSRFIQQALRSKDRQKIRNIRDYLKKRSSFELNEPQQAEQFNQYIDSKSFEAFKLHQQRLSSVVRKLKRRL